MFHKKGCFCRLLFGFIVLRREAKRQLLATRQYAALGFSFSSRSLNKEGCLLLQLVVCHSLACLLPPLLDAHPFASHNASIFE